MAYPPRKDILMSIQGKYWEVSRFISNHPGEGIHDIYLRNFDRKTVNEEFERYHYDDQPEEWLSTAEKKKYDEGTGIFYVGPAYFKSKIIPKYFHFFQPDTDRLSEYQKALQEGDFFIVPATPNEGSTAAVEIFFREKGKERASELAQLKNGKWTHRSSTFDSLDQLVDEQFVKLGFKGV